jgi:hypothetical protein
MSKESTNPERDELWARHDGLTPACCAEMIALAGKLERERDEARAALSALALHLSMGIGDNSTTAQQYYERILEGLELLTTPIVEQIDTERALADRLAGIIGKYPHIHRLRNAFKEWEEARK